MKTLRRTAIITLTVVSAWGWAELLVIRGEDVAPLVSFFVGVSALLALLALCLDD